MPTCYRFIVSGHVQGVGFRRATLREARRLSIDGWVQNRADGNVEGQVSATNASALAEFRCWLDHGPPTCNVTAVVWTASPNLQPLAAGTGFVIRR